MCSLTCSYGRARVFINGIGLVDCGDKPIPNVISISYHFSPDFNDPSITPVVSRQCTEIAKVRGRHSSHQISHAQAISIFPAQFDWDHVCCIVWRQRCLVRGWPARLFGQWDSRQWQSRRVLRWATACIVPVCNRCRRDVGGSKQHGALNHRLSDMAPDLTDLIVGTTQVNDPEIATTQFPSGGGFSNVFARPTWQETQVANYLAKFAPDYAADIFNRSGRGYPDVAANGCVCDVSSLNQLNNGGFCLLGGLSLWLKAEASLCRAEHPRPRPSSLL